MIPGGLLPIHHRRLLAYDNFSEVDNTAIVGKSLDIGGTWTQQRTSGTGTFTVINTRAGLTIQGSLKAVICEVLPTPDVVVSCNLKPTTTTDTCSIVARSNGTAYVASSAGTWVEGRLTANGTILIQQFLNGVSSTLVTNATGTSVAGTANDCTLTVSGNTATFVTPIGTVTGTMNTGLASNTRCGFAINNNAGIGQSIDNFKVEAL